MARTGDSRETHAAACASISRERNESACLVNRAMPSPRAASHSVMSSACASTSRFNVRRAGKSGASRSLASLQQPVDQGRGLLCRRHHSTRQSVVVGAAASPLASATGRPATLRRQHRARYPHARGIGGGGGVSGSRGAVGRHRR